MSQIDRRSFLGYGSLATAATLLDGLWLRFQRSKRFIDSSSKPLWLLRKRICKRYSALFIEPVHSIDGKQHLKHAHHGSKTTPCGISDI